MDTKQLIDYLKTIGMPTLQLIAYKQVNLTTPTPTHTTPTNTVLPINEQALNLYKTCERTIQYIAAEYGAKPYGWDVAGHKRCTLDWHRCLTHLTRHVEQISQEDADALADYCTQIDKLLERAPERRLVGVCTNCLESGNRVALYAVTGQRTLQCPECTTVLDTAQVRAAYLNAAGVLHITRTQAGAARWCREELGVHVTGKQVGNWRARGMVHAVHVEGWYWQWSVLELAQCATRLQ